MVLDERRPLNAASSRRVPLQHYSSSEDPRRPAQAPPGGKHQSGSSSVDSSIWRYINGWFAGSRGGAAESSRQEAKKRCKAALEEATRGGGGGATAEGEPRKCVKAIVGGEQAPATRSRQSGTEHGGQAMERSGQLRVARSFSLRHQQQQQQPVGPMQRVRLANSSLRAGLRSYRWSQERRRDHLYRCSSELVRDSRRRFGSVFASLLLVASLQSLLLNRAPITTEAAAIPISQISLADDLQPPSTGGADSDGDDSISGATDELAGALELELGPELQAAPQPPPTWYESAQQENLAGEPVLVYGPGAAVAAAAAPAAEEEEADTFALEAPAADESAPPEDTDYAAPAEVVAANERNKRDLVWLERRRLNRDRASEPPPWRKLVPERRDSPPRATRKPQNRRNQRESASQLYQALLSGLLEGALRDPELVEGVYNEIELKLKADEAAAAAALSSGSLGGSASSSSNSAATIGSPSLAALTASGARNKSLKLEHLQQHLASLAKWPLEASAQLSAASPPPPQPGEQPTSEELAEPESTLRIVGDELVSTADEQEGPAPPQGATYLEVDEAEPDAAYHSLPSAQLGAAPEAARAAMFRAAPARLQSAPPADINLVAGAGELGAGQVMDASGAALPAEPQFHVLEDIDQVDSGAESQSQQQQQQPPLDQLTGAGQLLNQWAPPGGPAQYDLAKRVAWLAWPSPTYRSQSASGAQVQAAQAPQPPPPPPPQELLDRLALVLIESGYLSPSQLVALGARLRQYVEAAFELPEESLLAVYPLNSGELLMKLDRVKVGAGSNQWLARNSVANYAPNLGPRGLLPGAPTPYGTAADKRASPDAAALFVVGAWPKGNKQNPVPLLAAILRTQNNNRRRPQLQAEALRQTAVGTMDAADELIPGARVKSIGADRLGLVETAAGSVSSLSGSVSGRLAALAAYLESVYASAEWAPDADSAGSNRHTELLGLRLSTLIVVALLALPTLLALLLLSVWLRCRRLPARPWTLGGGGGGGGGTGSLSGSLKSLWPRGASAMQNKSAGPALARWASQDSGLTGSSGQATVTPGTKEKASGADEATGRSRGLGAAHQLAQRLNELLRGMRRGGSDQEQVYYDDDEDDDDDDDDDDQGAASGRAESTERLLTEKRDSKKPPGVGASGSKFRTSQSYIRSLIEALGRAGSSGGVGEGPTGECASSTGTSGANESPPARDSAPEPGPPEVGAAQANAPVVVAAQMDISAAHLILDYMERHLEDKEALRKEWQEVRSLAQTRLSGARLEREARVALQAKNKDKNLSPAVVPFDRNRIKLAAAEPGHDYINASFIHDDNLRKPTHIIAQGPLEKTSGHFWQMVWEQNVSTIVMLTRLSEAGTRLCHCYWPSSNSAGSEFAASTCAAAEQAASQQQHQDRRMSVTSVYTGPANGSKPVSVANGELNNNLLRFQLTRGPDKHTWKTLEVHLVSEHVSSSDYIVRNMYLVDQSTGETRSVTQFHYLQWPHNGIPSNARSLLEFRRKVHKSYRNLSSPILVHCSDGGPRSGTYTLIDIILERIRNGAKEIDPRATLEHLADQRPGLCGTQSQFEFVLLALAEEIQIILQALPQ